MRLGTRNEVPSCCACRFPGADGIGAFWCLLEAGENARPAEPAASLYAVTGTSLNTAIGRVAFALGLGGPAMAVDTAEDNSTAIHHGCGSVREHIRGRRVRPQVERMTKKSMTRDSDGATVEAILERTIAAAGVPDRCIPTAEMVELVSARSPKGVGSRLRMLLKTYLGGERIAVNEILRVRGTGTARGWEAGPKAERALAQCRGDEAVHR